VLDTTIRKLTQISINDFEHAGVFKHVKIF